MKNQKTNQEAKIATFFSFKDLAKTAGASKALRSNPEDLEAREELMRGLFFLLNQKHSEKPSLSVEEAAAELAEECSERATAASLYLEALIEEGEEVWEDRWDELGIDLDWGDQLDGLSLEVEVNADLERRFLALA